MLNLQEVFSVLPMFVLLLVMLAARTTQAAPDQFPCGYDYIASAGAWFKMHTERAYRTEASYTCFSEDAKLASPTNEVITKAMVTLMDFHNNNKTSSMLVHTPITVTDDMNHNIDPQVDDDMRWVSIALTETGKWQIVSRFTALPFICYRKGPQDLRLNECGTTDPEYKLDNRTNKCYKFHRNLRNWVSAVQSCDTEGGYLAVINSEEENKVIKDIFAQNPAEVIPAEIYKDYAFLGYWADDTRVWRTVQGQTLSEVGYEFWLPGEPNKNSAYEYCGTVQRDGKLLDGVCDRWLPYICEKDINININSCSTDLE